MYFFIFENESGLFKGIRGKKYNQYEYQKEGTGNQEKRSPDFTQATFKI